MLRQYIVAHFVGGALCLGAWGCGAGEDLAAEDGDFSEYAATVGTYQAENYTFQSGCSKAAGHAGFTGTGFVDFGGNGSLIEWNNINAPSAGQYTLVFRYANGSAGSRQAAVTVNDTTTAGNVTFGKTGAWTTWATDSIKVTLKQGNNKIRVTANTGSGGPNLDKMDVTSEGGTGTGGTGGTGGPCGMANEGGTATLSCPSGQVIGSIPFASYGTPTGSCPSFSTGACHASSSKSQVETRCLNKQSCSVGANNGVFGDPCPGRGKNLAVAFTCKNVASAGPCAQVAEGSTASLSCPSGQVIKTIAFASYGTPSGTCPSLVKGTCHASNSQSLVESRCLNKQSCSVGATNSVFGDPCAGTGKKLAIAYSCGSGTTPTTEMPVFLLAGQSNMEGNVDRTLLNNLLSDLAAGPSGTLQQRLESRLTSWYQNYNNGYAMYGYSAQKVALEASELIRLNGAGLVNASLTQPYAKVLCTNTDAAPQGLTLNCGNPFGPELILGRFLGTTAHSPTSLVKVAKGGTSLKVDWLPPSAASRTGQAVGPLYRQLSQRIKSLQSNPASVHPNCVSQKCRWAAFVWFQGENDTFDAEYAQAYQENLRSFISDVRSEIGASRLPVIIVEIGAWAQSMQFGATVAAAQQAVANADPNAALVVTDDLSGFYHYDPAAQLIIGERIAKALVPKLQ